MNEKPTKPESKTKTYLVNNVNQLIDINGELTNFSANFLVKSQDGKPFEILVIDQDSLGNEGNMPFRKVDNGKVDGEISHDSGTHKTYYIILKSSVPTKCDLDLDIREIEPKTQPVSVPEATPPIVQKPDESVGWFKIFLIIAVLVAVVCGIYYVWGRTTEVTEQKSYEHPNTNILTRLNNLKME